MKLCECGKPATFRCGIGVPGLTIVLCDKPVCGRQPNTGCAKHRHRSGTMGFPDWGTVVRTANWGGYDPDGPGLWEWIKAMAFTTMATKRQAAQRAWKDTISMFAPNAPLPPFQVRVKDRMFRGNPDGTITDITEESK